MSAEPTADSLAAVGTRAFADGDYTRAISAFEQAQRAFTSQGDEIMAARMANNLSVALLKSGKAVEALSAAEGTDKVFEAAGDPVLQGMALGNQAAALADLKRHDEALDLFRKAAALFKAANQRDYEATVLQNMSTLQIQMGQRIAALGSMAQALDVKPHLSLREKFLKRLIRIAVNLMGGKG